ncbi:glycosyl hydrolase [Paenibacillus sp. WLX1005]|uniref:glycosyl hydrolase n=1 Tax=Paenibacillus sp. WLX1005 TaxID=3243766 RepID=UPI0039840B7D
MRTLSSRRARVMISIWIIAVLGVAIFFTARYMMKPAIPSTAQFMDNYMRNANGTIASYLQAEPSTDPNIVAGREALSESVGIWMQYNLLQDDSTSFHETYKLLTTYFLSPQHYIRWKLEEDGTSRVNTYALGDDLRIVGALLDAYDRWQQPEYLNTAKQITDTLWQHGLNNGYLVDYYDFQHRTSADQLSLTYIDTAALEQMQKVGLADAAQVDKHLQLLRQIPNDGLFYPRLYQVSDGTYTYDKEVNLIDQLIIGLHLTELKQPPQKLVDFMKQQFQQDGKLYGRYHAADHTRAVDYESPAVYGLAILLALQMNDREWADQLYTRMTAFRTADGPYAGGYVSDGNTHAFDDLQALLAETSLQH